MKSLVVEDDFVSRAILQKILSPLGECHAATNGKEAVEAVQMAWEAGEPYVFICLDIMMPEMDGQTALKEIREFEEAMAEERPPGTRVKVVMTTALDDPRNVMTAFKEECDGYLTKPVRKDKLMEMIESMGLAKPG